MFSTQRSYVIGCRIRWAIISLKYHQYFQAADRMRHFLDRLNRDNEELYLEGDLELYGRDEHLNHVSDLLFDENYQSKPCKF